MVKDRAWILDYGAGNIGSTRRYLKRNSFATVDIQTREREPDNSDLLVIPGVGSFGQAIRNIRNKQLGEIVAAHALSGGRVLGICLGMQLLLDSSEESPGKEGLGLIGGEALHLGSRLGSEAPLIGWQQVVFFDSKKRVELFFAHSFYASPSSSEVIYAYADNSEFRYPAVIKRGSVVGVQFHPEKSLNQDFFQLVGLK